MALYTGCCYVLKMIDWIDKSWDIVWKCATTKVMKMKSGRVVPSMRPSDGKRSVTKCDTSRYRHQHGRWWWPQSTSWSDFSDSDRTARDWSLHDTSTPALWLQHIKHESKQTMQTSWRSPAVYDRCRRSVAPRPSARWSLYCTAAMSRKWFLKSSRHLRIIGINRMTNRSYSMVALIPPISAVVSGVV